MPENEQKERLIERLRAAGLRLTPQRLAIYGALVDSKRHPSAQDLYEALEVELPSLSPATVYNTLEVLVEHGLVHEIGDAGDGMIHYDADLEPHVNLICTNCHRIDDFELEAIASVDQVVAAQSGYRVKGARIVYYGLCPECQAQADAQGTNQAARSN